ncbi:MAG: zinc ribbon domain-containing protein [Candidatus Woesearchaeota archaeon]
MPYCQICGTEIEEGDDFCLKCGKKTKIVVEKVIELPVIQKVTQIIIKDKEEVRRNITAGLVTSWILGVLFILDGFISILGLGDSKISFVPDYINRLMGSIELCIGLFILPIINRYLEQKFNIHISRGLKILIVTVFTLILIILVIKYFINYITSGHYFADRLLT